MAESFGSRVKNAVTSKEMLKIYNKQAVVGVLSQVGGTAAGLLIPGGYSLVQTVRAASSQKDIQRLRELEEERRKGYAKA